MENIRDDILVILPSKNCRGYHTRSFLIKTFVGLLFLLLNLNCYGVEIDGVSISSGYGVCGMKPFRIGLQQNFLQHWCRGEDDNWPITGYWELSFYHLQGKKKPRLISHQRSHGKLNVLTLAPVFRLQNTDSDCGFFPYVELGVGVSLFTRNEIAGRELGLHFQFEDRFSMGIRFGCCQQYDINYRIVHFSNAYIGPINHGLNIHFLTLGYWFN